MTHEESNNIASVLAGLLVNIYVIIKLSNLFADGSLDGPDRFMVWARAMLWVIPVGILVVIICVILMNIIAAVAQRDENPSFIVDERDKAIEVYGMRFTQVGISVAFIGGLIALAMDVDPLYAMIGMFFGFSLGDLIGGLAKMARYRWGL